MVAQFLAQFAIVRVPEHRAYRDLLLARLISALGTWTAFYAVRIALYQQTGSAWWVSILLFSELVPGVVLGIAVGPLIDRWPRQRMMILSDLGGALAFGVLPFVHSPAGICGISAVAGFSAAFFRPGCYAAIPNLVAEHSVVAANALMQGAENLATLAGPVFAGLGIVLLGSGPVYGLNAASFILSALLLVRIGNRLQSHVPVRIGRAHWREVRSGLSLVRYDRHLSSIFLIWSWATLAYTGINVAEIVLTTKGYGVGNIGFGVFVAASAAGIVIGNIVAMEFINRLTVYGGYRASFLITAAGVAICAVSPGLVLGCVGAVIFGAGNGIGLVCNVTLIQQTVSDNRRGQMFAVLGSLVQTFTLIGTLAAGPITQHIGPRLVWGLSAALLVVGYVNAVIVTTLRARHDRRADGAPVETSPELAPTGAGGESPASAFERIGTLLDEIELTRQAEVKRGFATRRRRRTRPVVPPSGSGQDV